MLQTAVASGWVGAHGMATYVVPPAMRNMIPFPFNLHALHLLGHTIDQVALVVVAVLAAPSVVRWLKTWGRSTTPEDRAYHAATLGGSLLLLVGTVIQRSHVYKRLDEALKSGEITYPMTPPVEEFDALMVRAQWVDLSMLAGGLLVAWAAGRVLLAADPKSSVTPARGGTRPG